MWIYEKQIKVDVIHNITQIVQKAYESGIDLHILFIDFGQAFDIIKSITLTKDAEEFGIPAKLIELIKVTTNIKSNSMYAIRYNK